MFKLKRLGLFPSLLTSVQILGADKLIPRARKCDAVQYLFYRALYEFHGQKFREAWDRFKATWNLLHPEDWTHRRRVAIYLVAIALCNGKRPSNDFLQKYRLFDELSALRDAIITGNFVTFKFELESRAKTLHPLNIYVFLLLNAHPAIYLNLIKRTWHLTGKQSSSIAFGQIRRVIEWYNLRESSDNFTNDELECILINLIGKVTEKEGE